MRWVSRPIFQLKNTRKYALNFFTNYFQKRLSDFEKNKIVKKYFYFKNTKLSAVHERPVKEKHAKIG